jgi:hypothetical protein
MNKSILARIEALEGLQRTAYKPPPPVPLSLYIVALFAGKWQPHESPADAYHRALGCENVADFHKLTPEELHGRHRAAFACICRRRGIDSATLEPREKFLALMKKLHRAKIAPAASWLAVAA